MVITGAWELMQLIIWKKPGRPVMAAVVVNYDGEGARKTANNKWYIWDQCKKKNISYRTYGEFTDARTASIPVLKIIFVLIIPAGI